MRTRQVRWTMPPEQCREFNHYIFLMNSANCELGLFIASINAQVELLDIKLAWLATLRLWALTNAGLAGYINMHTREPITQSEHEQRLERPGRRWYHRRSWPSFWPTATRVGQRPTSSPARGRETSRK